MKSSAPWFPVLLVAVLWFPAAALRAADTVTIPKSRLEELERKETELEKLKRELNRAESETRRLKEDQARAAAATAAAPAPVHVSPPMAGLPPLQPGEVVDARDLLGHYAADPAAAAERYGRKRFIVRGEIAGFSKPGFQRPYIVHLHTGNPAKPVSARITPPDFFKAVFSIKNGTELVGTDARDARTTLWRLGDKVLIEGACKGLDSGGVDMGACTINPAP